MKQLKKWVKHAVFYMETRKGIFILGQLLNFPYIRFYEEFTEDPQAPLSGELRNKNILFTVEALSRVLRQGNFIYRKDIDPDRREIDSKLWIRSLDGFRVVRLFEDENIELTFQITAREPGGMLLEIDPWWQPTMQEPIRKGYYGICDDVLLYNIPIEDYNRYARCEVPMMYSFPLLNERLYLNYKAQHYVDPIKDLMFGRPIPSEYNVFFSLYANFTEHKEQLLTLYR